MQSFRGGPALATNEHFETLKERNIRPMLLAEAPGPGQRTFLLMPDGTIFWDVRFGQIGRRKGLAERYAASRQTVCYVVGAVGYHCLKLGEVASRTCGRLARALGSQHGELALVGIPGKSEPYYEFDALITAARRAYEALRHPLWKAFGNRGPCPRSFETVLTSAKILPELQAVLQQSWESYGRKLKDYRDCIVHYVPIDYGTSQIQLFSIPGNIWGLQVPIPDNPDAKSKREFRFNSRLDALTYGWELANEILKLATAVFDALTGKLPSTLPSLVRGTGFNLGSFSLRGLPESLGYVTAEPTPGPLEMMVLTGVPRDKSAPA